jgi:UDP-glucose 4-epimerase
MPSLLVTGGAGFIGSHVVERFLADGDNVVVLDDLSSGRRKNLPDMARCHVMDVGDHQARDVIATGDFEVVAHLAAQIDVRKSVADPLADSAINVGGTINVLEAIRHLPAGRRPRLIFASTAAIYGQSAEMPTTETAATGPEAPYGIGKLAAEYYLAYYSRVWDLDCIVLRFGNVFGPRQNPQGEAGVVAIFGSRALRGLPLTIYGSGEQTRDYIYVGDVASAFHSAASVRMPPAGALDARAFNVATGIETSVLELARLIGDVSGRAPTIEFAPAREGEVIRSCLAPGKANRSLGWRSTTDLRQGLAATVAWIQAAVPTASN